ncbi:hypothetical protein [Sulfitobacter alexandrii]|nr:hypothetical protein [Sulfitobacter alexandrii]
MTRHFLGTAAIAALMSTAAYAGEGNDATLDQIGAGNSALIEQISDNNQAGGPRGLFQDGDNNEMTVEQSGSIGGNRLATANRNNAQYGQNGDNNVAEIEQSGNNNTVLELFQNAPDTGAPADTNVLSLTQSSDGNLIDYVLQTFSGASPVGANDMSIEQSNGDDNRIFNASQQGNGNTMDVEMTGTSNFLRVSKQAGVANSSTVIISGDENGFDSSAQYNIRQFPLGGAYAGTKTSVPNAGGRLPLAPSSVQQNGTGNGTYVELQGNRTAFGVSQNGNGNDALGIVIRGDDNAFSSDQYGDGNTIALTTVTGMGNSIGFAQEGDDNLASADVAGDDNRVRLTQFGDRNDTTLWVGTSDNTATLDVIGDDNRLEAQQRFGGSNVMTVNVTGDNNNNSGALFTGAALDARNAANGATGLTFGRGRLWQHGANNDLTLTVSSSDNLFATLQQGDNNTINGTIGGGDGNKAAVAQLGSDNTATFSQMGSGNNAGIIQ